MAAGSVSSLIEQHSQLALLLMFCCSRLSRSDSASGRDGADRLCSVLASQGAVSIVPVIVVAIAAAIIGDDAGYWVARERGRAFLNRYDLTRRYAEGYLPKGERFFSKHGGKAVFLGLFVTPLRVTTAWTAAGGVVWTTGVALAAFYLSEAVATVIGRYLPYAAAAALLLTVIGVLIAPRLERRVLDAE